MDAALSPRDIQARIRSGSSVADVAEESGLAVERVEAFALPVIAEREHIARTAQGSTVRRRDASHRRLGDVVSERLTARGIDPDDLVWDAWRRPDLKWVVTAALPDAAAPRKASFVFDLKGRFSVADDTDARWMIGEEVRSDDPNEENTVDLDDELALVRATQDTDVAPSGEAGDDVPQPHLASDDPGETSELDELYDLLSGVSEDSVRIYVGLDEASAAEPAASGDAAEAPEPEAEPTPDQPAEDPADEPVPAESEGDVVADAEVVAAVAHVEIDAVVVPVAEEPELDDEPTLVRATVDDEQDEEQRVVTEPEQDALIEEHTEQITKPKQRRKRASVPSWDEIMFGGPSK